ncbi:MAG: hypothetical protein WC346_03950 [Methanogenium sp.]|jgi:hypothetical protein
MNITEYIVTSTTLSKIRHSIVVKASTPIGAFLEAYKHDVIKDIDDVVLVTIVANINCTTNLAISNLEVAAITKHEIELLNQILEGEEI